VYRGEIWWASLPDPVGSEPGYRRPVLIVQDDIFTQSRINTVIVVIITSNTQLAEAPGNTLLLRVYLKIQSLTCLKFSRLIKNF
jgi:mRNA interferase MazF